MVLQLFWYHVPELGGDLLRAGEFWALGELFLDDLPLWTSAYLPTAVVLSCFCPILVPSRFGQVRFAYFLPDILHDLVFVFVVFLTGQLLRNAS